MFVSLLVAACLFDLLDRACRAAGIQHKELAADLGTSSAQFSRDVRVGRIPLGKVLALPLPVRRAVWEAMREACGVEPPMTARDVMDLIRPAMLRAGGRHVDGRVDRIA